MHDIDLFFMGSSGILMCILLWFRYSHYVRQNPRPLKKLVGPTYWGVYAGARIQDDPELVKIECHRPASGSPYTVGSSRYASGGAVRSARG